jgi:predicted nucleic-acid-binding Zn-ribbon protein
MPTYTCVKCGNGNLVEGILAKLSQPLVNVFEGNTKLPNQKLKTVTCLNCGFVEIYLDKNKP